MLFAEHLLTRRNFIYKKILTLKIACSVRRWRSVKTKRGFLGAELCSAVIWSDPPVAVSSLLLTPTTTENRDRNEKLL